MKAEQKLSIDNSASFEKLSIKQQKVYVKAVQKSSSYEDRKLLNLYNTHENSLLWMSLFSMLVILQSGLLPVFTYLCLLAPWLSWWLRKKKIKHYVLGGSIISSAGFLWAISKLVISGLSYAVLAATIALLGILTGRVLSRENLTHDLQVILLAFALCLASTVLTPSLLFVPFFFFFSIFSILALTTRQLIKGFEESAALKSGSRTHQALISWRFLLSIVFVSQTVMAFSILVFLAFPRLGGDGFKFSGSDSLHFPDAVNLTNSPWGRSKSNKIVARIKGVELDDFARGLYLRGGVYEKLSTQGFSQRPKQLLSGQKNLQLKSQSKAKKYTIELQPFSERMLFTLGDVNSIWPEQHQNLSEYFRIHKGPQGGLETNKALQTIFKYEIYGHIISPHRTQFKADAAVLESTGLVGSKAKKEVTNQTTNQTKKESPNLKEEAQQEFLLKKQHALQQQKKIQEKIKANQEKSLFKNSGKTAVFFELPSNLDSRVTELAKSLVVGATNAEEIAKKISEALIHDYTYTQNLSSEGSSDAVSDFLFNSKAGHCEYFATAFALMMRTQGYAARVIGGFQGGILEPSTGDILFKQRNAHAWVEWYHPKKGWLIADPTPTPNLERLGVFEQIAINIQELWDTYVVNFSVSDQIIGLNTLWKIWKQYRDQILLSILVTLLSLILAYLLYQRLREKRSRNRNKIVDVFLTIVRTALDKNIGAHQSNRELLELLVASSLLKPHDFEEIRKALYFHEQRQFAGKKPNEVIYKKKYNLLLDILKDLKQNKQDALKKK